MDVGYKEVSSHREHVAGERKEMDQSGQDAMLLAVSIGAASSLLSGQSQSLYGQSEQRSTN